MHGDNCTMPINASWAARPVPQQPAVCPGDLSQSRGSATGMLMLKLEPVTLSWCRTPRKARQEHSHAQKTTTAHAPAQSKRLEQHRCVPVRDDSGRSRPSTHASKDWMGAQAASCLQAAAIPRTPLAPTPLGSDRQTHRCMSYTHTVQQHEQSNRHTLENGRSSRVVLRREIR